MRIHQHSIKITAFIKLGLAILVVLIALSLTGFSKQPPETETYLVQYGDTLDNITSEYMKKNTYGKRDFDEFKQGIIELNMDKYPRIRYGEIYAGERLEINYWIRKEVKEWIQVVW